MSEFLSAEELYGDLFYAVHREHLFQDGKAFSDARAKMNPKIIYKTYLQKSEDPDFDLKAFVHKYFELPVEHSQSFDKEGLSIEKHISELWKFLTRSADQPDKRSSKISLPHSYIVPGGRFDEIYYWDSYFTMLGLAVDGHEAMILNMVDNFKYLIDTVGHIPNGNRTYFLSRSQPPFYSLMVKLLIKLNGENVVPDYIDSLVKE